MAERFNGLPPSAVRASKKLMRGPGLAELQRVIAEEAELFGQRLRSPEAIEAFQAFFQKRAPDFSKFD
jgi:enoyl-CoA hydratase/carnithine racemase